MKIGKLEVLRSEGCAWQAVYAYWGKTKVFHVGLNPRGDSGRLELFGSVAGRRDCTGGRALSLLEWRVSLIRAPWRYQAGRVYRRWYRATQWVIYGIDGRHGWKWLRSGTK